MQNFIGHELSGTKIVVSIFQRDPLIKRIDKSALSEINFLNVRNLEQRGFAKLFRFNYNLFIHAKLLKFQHFPNFFEIDCCSSTNRNQFLNYHCMNHLKLSSRGTVIFRFRYFHLRNSSINYDETIDGSFCEGSTVARF